MSTGVAQVKKRFIEFETYLRNDTEGVRRLKLLKDDVNVLRKSLAAAEKEKESAVASMESARQRADKASAAAAEIGEKNRTLSDQVNSLIAQVKILTQEMERGKTEDDEDASAADNANEYMAVLHVVKKLRKTHQHFPSQMSVKSDLIDPEAKHMLYSRESIASGWSYRSLWILGAAVALIAALNGRITIIGERRVKNMKVPDSQSDSGSLIRNVYMWLWRSVDNREMDVINAERLSKNPLGVSVVKVHSEDLRVKRHPLGVNGTNTDEADTAEGMGL